MVLPLKAGSGYNLGLIESIEHHNAAISLSLGSCQHDQSGWLGKLIGV
jgi:hypothetical protein